MKTFKNKQEIIDFVKHQLNIELCNDKEHCLNNKRKLLYTEISGVYGNSVLRLLNQYKIRYEKHHRDNYWIHIL